MLELQEKIENHITKRTLSNKDDKEFFLATEKL